MRARSLFVLIASLLAITFGWWFFAPGELRFRSFDPALVARAEAGLWRDYYEGKPVELIMRLALNDYRAFGLSPYASFRAGMTAADAARRFQRSRSRAEAQVALKPLTEHFKVVRDAALLDIDPAEAARLELEWWQLRRETASLSYASAIARATGYLYGVPADRLADYARLRAAAMDLRDRKGRHITNADWAEIEALLARAYRALRPKVVRSG